MAIFGRQRDINFMIGVNRELINDVIEQQVDYYKPYLPEMKSKDTSNLYGEASSQKTWYRPVRLNCLITYESNVAVQDDQFGIDLNRTATFAFLREDLLPIPLVIQIGDIIEYRGEYFEVDQTNETQFVLGKDKVYPKSVGSDFGRSVSIIVTAHMTAHDHLQIVKTKL